MAFGPGLPFLHVSEHASASPIDFATIGDHIVIPGSPGLQTHVYGMFFSVDGPVNVTFRSGATALSGSLQFANASNIVLPTLAEPWFVTAIGEDFIMNTNAARQLGGRLIWLYGPV
jgi:hypothetical protein